jgi:hypothetical protein
MEHTVVLGGRDEHAPSGWILVSERSADDCGIGGLGCAGGEEAFPKLASKRGADSLSCLIDRAFRTSSINVQAAWIAGLKPGEHGLPNFRPQG